MSNGSAGPEARIDTQLEATSAVQQSVCGTLRELNTVLSNLESKLWPDDGGVKAEQPTDSPEPPNGLLALNLFIAKDLQVAANEALEQLNRIYNRLIGS